MRLGRWPNLVGKFTGRFTMVHISPKSMGTCEFESVSVPTKSLVYVKVTNFKGHVENLIGNID